MILLVSFVAKSASAIIISGLKDAKAYEWVQLLGGRNFWLAPSSPRHVAGRVEGSLVQARIVKALFALAQFLPLVNAKGVTPSAAARLLLSRLMAGDCFVPLAMTFRKILSRQFLYRFPRATVTTDEPSSNFLIEGTQKTNARPLGLAFVFCVPSGSRTRVATVKGWCPRPLDDGDLQTM